MDKDDGGWLSAQQAVQADGSERDNLPLINKKLPSLRQDLEASPSSPSLEQQLDSATIQSMQALIAKGLRLAGVVLVDESGRRAIVEGTNATWVVMPD